MKLGHTTLAREFIVESYVNELIFERMGLVTFLSTEGGESLFGVSAAKVAHVWHDRHDPGHCGV